MQMQNADMADKTAFHTKAAVDPLYAKWAPEVEGELAKLRLKGDNPQREVLMDFLIGRQMRLNRGSKENKMQAKQGAQRVSSQRTRPANSGSDTQAARRQTTSLERRLENTPI
jgi:hypothetical protein